MRSPESLFRVPPFPAFPSVSRYVAIGSIAEAHKRLSRGVESRDALSMVIGPPGTGKSLLANLLCDSFSASRKVVRLGDVPIESPRDFYRQLLYQLGMRPERSGADELNLMLVDHLRSEESHGGGLLVVIDEAQSLTADVLESARMVTNIMRRDEPRVSAVLLGGPALDDRLTAPHLESLTQRVATRCYLHPFTAAETRVYIEESIRGCGADPRETITEEAIAAVHHACCGVPRLINQLMTEAIDGAEIAGQNVIDEAVVDQAWAQLQQLPGPAIDPPALPDASLDVEFGELSDLDERSDVDERAEFEAVASREALGRGDVQDSEGRIAPEIEFHTLAASPSCLVPAPSDARLETAAFGDGADFCPGEVGPILAELTGQDLLFASPALDPPVGIGDEAQRPDSVVSPAPPLGHESVPSAADRRQRIRHAYVELFGEFEEEEIVVSGNAPAALTRSAWPAHSAWPRPVADSDRSTRVVGSGAGPAVAGQAASQGQTAPEGQGSSSDRGTETTDPSRVPSPFHVEHELQRKIAELSQEVVAAREGMAEGTPFPMPAESDPVDHTDKGWNVDPRGAFLWLNQEDDSRFVRDDSDLLVIEDLLSDASPVAKTRVDPGQPVAATVDFQAILNRMRAV